MKNFKKYRDDNSGQYHFSYSFIMKGKLGPTEKLILNYMMSDYDMNGIVRWTREKYRDDLGVSYGSVRGLFKKLIYNGVLELIPGTTNYNIEVGLLIAKLDESRSWEKLEPVPKKTDNDCSVTDNDCRNTDNDCRNTVNDCSETDTDWLHIDNKDLIHNKDLYREEQDSSSFIKEESSPSTTTTTTTKPPITEEDILSLTDDINEIDEREKLFGK